MGEAIIAIIAIVISLISTVNKSKQVKKNAPGKAAAPSQPAAPAASAQRMRTEQARTPAAPTVHPTVSPSPAQPSEPFWQQVSKAIREELTAEQKKPETGHEAAGKMDEGDSRECEHGSLGGSMAYEGHQEGREVRKSVKPVRTSASPTGEALYRPAMNAQEMRRAVVMAEILKRPQERMAEQARRWSVR